MLMRNDLGGSTPDNYNVPIRADGEWFSGLDTVVKVCLALGDDCNPKCKSFAW